MDKHQELPKTDGNWRRARDGSLYDADKQAPPDSDLKEVDDSSLTDELFKSSNERSENPDEEVL